jgi:hypothetical protein
MNRFFSDLESATDLMLQNIIRALLVVDKSTSNADRPIRILTLLDFTRYQEFENGDVDNDDIAKILEYYL